MGEKFDGCEVIKKLFFKKKDKTTALLHKKRLSKFKGIAKKARIQKKQSNHEFSAADVMHLTNDSKNENISELQQEINAYKAVIESRSNGLSVRLARKLINYIHDDLKIIHLLDPMHTEEITVHSLVSFYRSKWDKIIL